MMLISTLAVLLWVLEGGVAVPGWGTAPSPSSAADEQVSGREGPKSVDGCATEHGCEPSFVLRFPPGADRAKFSPRLLVALRISAKGKVEGVTVKKSSGLKEVDEQILKIVREWRFKEEKSAREMTAVVSVHLR